MLLVAEMKSIWKLRSWSFSKSAASNRNLLASTAASWQGLINVKKRV